MKKIIVLLLLVVFGFGQAQNGFDTGNALYRKGDFQGAVTAYEQVLKTKKQSAELYFNLGNAYYKLNQVAPSIYNYEKALLLSPNDSEIAGNLKFAQKLQIDEVKEIPTVGFGKLLRDYTSWIHYDSWAVVAVIASFVALAFFAGYYFSGTTVSKRIFFIGIFVALLVLALAFFAAAFEKNALQNERPAIVFSGIASIKSEPEKNAPDAFVLHEGAKVFVIEHLDNWRKVHLQDGSQGWIEAAAIRELKP